MVDKVVAASTMVVFSYLDKEIYVLLGLRSNEADAFPNTWCLPGGMKESWETFRECATRELYEETTLYIPEDRWSLVEVYSGMANFDPRGEVANICFTTAVKQTPSVKGQDDLQKAKWVRVDIALSTELAFNHENLLVDSLQFIPEDY